MNKQVLLREAKASERAIIADFQLRMAWETESLLLDEEKVTQGVGAVFSDPGKGKYYVAVDGDIVIGCMLNTYEWSDWRNGHFIWFQSVWIEPDWRGKGVFRLMYEHIKKMVQENDQLKGIRLYVFHTNKNARSVYRSIGMEDESYHMFEWVKPNI